MQRARRQIPRNDPTACTIVHDQVDGEVFDIELSMVLQRLLIQGVQYGMPGAIGGCAGTLRDALTVVGRHATERTLVNAPVISA